MDEVGVLHDGYYQLLSVRGVHLVVALCPQSVRKDLVAPSHRGYRLGGRSANELRPGIVDVRTVDGNVILPECRTCTGRGVTCRERPPAGCFSLLGTYPGEKRKTSSYS